MTPSPRPHDDEGGEAPCFAHLIEDPVFVADLLDLTAGDGPERAEGVAPDDAGAPPQSER